MRHIGSTRVQRLQAYFGSLEAAWHASEKDLRHAELSEQPLTQLLKTRATLDLDDEMAKVEAANAHLITLADDNYPDNLRSIPDAPSVLYVKGTLLPTDTLALAVVGTRKATRYGRDATRRIAHRLAVQNVTIISGMAQGIDAAAHRGALDGEGRTIAVLGNGIDIVYPREHDDLAAEIITHGALISEFPLGTPPTGMNFPKRNRIISGLSLAVMIAEAPERSGALITAEAALEQGRDVFAIPANIFNKMGTGSNRLIQEGAKLVMNTEDILNELDITYTERETQQRAKTIMPTNDKESILLSHLEHAPLHVDELVRLTGLATPDVTATLTVMELKGLAQSVGHMQYCLPNR